MSDTHKVTTDALETLGTIIDERAGRDAIHLAVEPMVAAVKLYPGQDVGIQDGLAGPTANPLGIVDPFLKAPVQPGERFWLVVYPRQITSLRHVWTHPAFGEPFTPRPYQSKEASESWLRSFCEQADCPGYDRVMRVIMAGEIGDGYDHSYINEEYLHFGGSDAHGEIPAEFWDHVEVVLGKKISQRPTYFSCSC